MAVPNSNIIKFPPSIHNTIHMCCTRHFEFRYYYEELTRIEKRIIDIIHHGNDTKRYVNKGKILEELKDYNFQEGAIEKGFKWLEDHFVIYKWDKDYDYYLEDEWPYLRSKSTHY